MKRLSESQGDDMNLLKAGINAIPQEIKELNDANKNKRADNLDRCMLEDIVQEIQQRTSK